MSPDPIRHSLRSRSWWLWVGYWVGLFVVMHMPISRQVQVTIGYGDKVIHFGLYFMLARLGGRHLLARDHRPSVAAWLGWAVVYAAYAAADEWLQSFFGRSTSLGDWLADLTGIAAGTALAARRSRFPGLSEHGSSRR